MNCAWHNSKCQLNCRICHMNLKNQAKFKEHIAKHTKQSKNCENVKEYSRVWNKRSPLNKHSP